MTIILDSNAVGKSKETLLKALIEAPQAVQFRDPSPFGEYFFTGADIEPGEEFAVVMEPSEEDAVRPHYPGARWLVPGFLVDPWSERIPSRRSSSPAAVHAVPWARVHVKFDNPGPFGGFGSGRAESPAVRGNPTRSQDL